MTATVDPVLMDGRAAMRDAGQGVCQYPDFGPDSQRHEKRSGKLPGSGYEDYITKTVRREIDSEIIEKWLRNQLN